MRHLKEYEELLGDLADLGISGPRVIIKGDLKTYGFLPNKGNRKIQITFPTLETIKRSIPLDQVWDYIMEGMMKFEFEPDSAWKARSQFEEAMKRVIEGSAGTLSQKEFVRGVFDEFNGESIGLDLIAIEMTLDGKKEKASQ